MAKNFGNVIYILTKYFKLQCMFVCVCVCVFVCMCSCMCSSVTRALNYASICTYAHACVLFLRKSVLCVFTYVCKHVLTS